MLLSMFRRDENIDYREEENSNNKDRGDLTQVIIITAGLAVASIVGIGGVATVVMEKGEEAANCITNHSAFTASGGIDSKDSCAPKSDLVESLTPNQATIAFDLKNWAMLSENFLKENGRYPNNDELELLGFKATTEAYVTPDKHISNFEYCATSDQSDYILTVYTEDGTVMYVSSNNTEAIKYDPGELIPNMRDGKHTGGWISPCYSGTPYSAADRAGLGQIGVLDENNVLISGTGKSALHRGAWSTWAI